MINTTLTTAAVQGFYDRLGLRHDMGAMFEREAKLRAISLLDVRPGQTVLNAGSGTGKDNVALADAAGPSGHVVATDLSMVMLSIGKRRAYDVSYCQADVASLPLLDNRFDRILVAYVIDLLPATAIAGALAEFRRVLRPDGRIALVSLTEGVDRASRAIVAAWKAAFSIHPLVCGGCRPVRLVPWLETAGLIVLSQEVITQMGVPSEIVLAERPML